MHDEITGTAEAMPIRGQGHIKGAAFSAFAAAYAEMRKLRNHETERAAVKHLADCIADGEVGREVFHQAWVLLDRLAEDEIGGWAELFRAAIDSCAHLTPGWSALKRCYRTDAEILVVVTESVLALDGPETIGFRGDTRGLLGCLTAHTRFGAASHHLLPDANVIVIPLERS